MGDYTERFDDPKMDYYRQTYQNSCRWVDEKIEDKKLIIYMEQGIGDQLMFFRFLRLIKEQSPKSITLHAHKDLERLIKHLGYEFLDKNNPELPEHDYHVCSLSLPFVLRKAIPIEPYIILEEKFELPEGINIGIAWEGSPDHPNNNLRNCPLSFFGPLIKNNVNLYHIQPVIHNWDLIKSAENFPLLGVEIKDWYDTAKLINSLDYIVTVDTGVLHLAGAMGKRAYAILGNENYDPRWDGLWYPTTRFIKGSWEECFKTVIEKTKPE